MLVSTQKQMPDCTRHYSGNFCKSRAQSAETVTLLFFRGPQTCKSSQLFPCVIAKQSTSLMLLFTLIWLHLTDESAFLMGDVTHIPQTAASHQRTPSKQRNVATDMLREDPRDSFYRGERGLDCESLLHAFPLRYKFSYVLPLNSEKCNIRALCLFPVPLMNNKFLQGVLPDCTYKPSYIIKDFPLTRYQGLQFVCIYVFIHYFI